MRRWAWKSATRLLGDHPDLIKVRSHLEQLQWKLEAEQAKAAEVEKKLETELAKTTGEKTRLETELENVREEKLQVLAREASTRKELQDCQARGKDLLEQVVNLTHKQRQTKQSLLDQQFKTETTPLERNRFEMELAEARGNARRAEDRAKKAEEYLARLKVVEKQAARAKELETQLAWTRQKSEAYRQALAAALEKVREFEEREARRAKPKPARRKKVPRTYRKPQIRTEKKPQE